MVRLFFAFMLVIFFYFVGGFIVSQYDLRVLPSEIKIEHPNGYYDYRGAINVHSNSGIGSGNYAEIIEEAKAAGLDFLFLTDLNLFQKPDALDGYNGNLLVFSAGEYSYLDSRLIYYGINKDNDPASVGEVQIRFTDYLSQDKAASTDSFILMAHPKRAGFSWTGPYPAGLDGIEPINLKSILKDSWDRSKLSGLWSLLIYPFNAKLSFIRLFVEPRNEFDLWDELSQANSTIGFLGSDATAKAVPMANYFLRFPSYEKTFEVATNHVVLKSELTGNGSSDKQKVFSALKKGNFYMSFDLLGEPRGFMALIKDKDKEFLMGSKIPFTTNLNLHVSLPSKPQVRFEIILYKNGEAIETFKEESFEFKIKSAGVYRLLVRVKPNLPYPDSGRWFSWIYTNPFFVQAP